MEVSGAILKLAFKIALALSGSALLLVATAYSVLMIGLAFGVDPLDGGITTNGVNAMTANTRNTNLLSA